MSLRLITGPANAAKAGHVLGAFRARLAEEPLLVVPAFRDVEHAQREAAERGAVLGARVVRFAWLFDEIVSRCADSPPRRRASVLQRELIVAAAVRGTELIALADSAARPGFVRATTRLIAELERSLVEPQRLAQALGVWAGDGARRQFASELAGLYRAYRDRLERARLSDDELYAWRAADALRANPLRWGGTPVFVYGFDDFTEIELDVIETLATRAEAEVTVSLPYERGRAAFRVLAPVFERLRGLAGADGHVELEAISEHYDDGSRAALHHVERTLFEAPVEAVPPPSPDGIVRLLGAGGERAEIELVAAEVLRELREGTEPGQIAVVFRDPPAYGSIVEQVFAAYGIPFSIDRTVPLAHTALGRSLLALLRCAACDGTADDLLAYLRAPGLLDHPELADRLEADVRQSGIRTADDARTAWQESGRWELNAIDRLRVASERGVAAMLEELDRQLQHLFTRPYRRTAHVFSGEERDDPRVWTAARAAIGQLRALVERRSAPWLNASDVHDALSELPVRLGDDPRPERVQIATPEAIRARRFEVVIVAGLQEGEFPRPAPPEPFLPDEDRHEIARASGLRLPMRDDQLDRERYLFYVCASRAERVLMLSSRFSDEEGGPQVSSFFLQDVIDLFEAGSLTRARTRRALADVTWSLDDAPTPAEWGRALALAGPRFQPLPPDGLSEPAVLDSLADRQLSTSALEAYSDCPVKWLVDRILRPEELEPDPEYMVRGNYAHAVLELTYLRLHERTGERKVTRGNLGVAEGILGEALREKQSDFQLSPQETRVRAAVRKLEFDLLRHLRRESESGSAFEPAHVELSFGGGIAPPLDIEGVTLSGKIDRVDVYGDQALVRDYKSGSTVWPVARWEEDRRIQVALYMIAVRELLGLKPVAGFYVPLSGQNPRPRGVVQAGTEGDVGAGVLKQDLKEPEEIEELLDGARRQVGELAREMRTGVLRPCPDTCSFRGGCTYPSICRSEG